jgi:predicted dehydrogenase
MSLSIDRRDFLQAAAATVAAGELLAKGVAAAASDEPLQVALIGCGGRGTHDAGLFAEVPGVRVSHVCDVDESRRKAAAEKLKVNATHAVSDLRRVLDDPAVDIILVTTPDHWHSPASILACDAGKHAYVEKPISHNIREGRLLVEAASRNKVHVQHGTQCRSTPMMIEAVKLLRNGVIGDVLVAKCWNVQRRGTIGRGEDTAPPVGFDYDNWVGPAPMIPYRTNRVHNRWTMWRHFGAGDMGNDGVHDLDYTRWGLGVETHPTTVSAIGSKYFFDDDQEFPDTQQVTFEYPGNGRPGDRRMLIYEQRLWSTNYPRNSDSGAEFYGTSGQMFLTRRGKVQVFNDQNKVVDLTIPMGAQNDALHVQNLCDAIRTGAALNADALIGHLSTTLCHLGNLSAELGRSLVFDPAAEQFVGDEQANARVRREYREHWGTPRGA